MLGLGSQRRGAWRSSSIQLTGQLANKDLQIDLSSWNLLNCLTSCRL